MKQVQYIPKRSNKNQFNSKKKNSNKKNNNSNRNRSQSVNRNFKNSQTTMYQIKQYNNDDVVIKRRHALLTVYANFNGTFRLTSLEDSALSILNPGLSTFPWLSKIASAYTKYTVENFKLEYVPLTGLMNAGQVSFYIDYEGRDPEPQHVSDFYDQKDTTTTAIFRRAVRNYQKPDLMSSVKEKIIKSDGAFDILEDFGKLYVGTEGLVVAEQDTKVIVGVMYAQYTIVLKIPQVNTNLGVGQIRTTSMQYTAEDGTFDATAFGTLAVINEPYEINNAPQYRIVNAGIYQVIIHMSYDTAIVNATPTVQVNQQTQAATYEVHRRPTVTFASHTYQAVHYLQLDIGDLVKFTLENITPLEVDNHFFNIAHSWYPMNQLAIRKFKRSKTPIQPRLIRQNAQVVQQQLQYNEESDMSTEITRQIEKVMNNKRTNSK